MTLLDYKHRDFDDDINVVDEDGDDGLWRILMLMMMLAEGVSVESIPNIDHGSSSCNITRHLS